MNLKIIFVNPNSARNVDKHLPKILAEALLNKIFREDKSLEATNNCHLNRPE